MKRLVINDSTGSGVSPREALGYFLGSLSTSLPAHETISYLKTLRTLWVETRPDAEETNAMLAKVQPLAAAPYGTAQEQHAMTVEALGLMRDTGILPPHGALRLVLGTLSPALSPEGTIDALKNIRDIWNEAHGGDEVRAAEVTYQVGRAEFLKKTQAIAAAPHGTPEQQREMASIARDVMLKVGTYQPHAAFRKIFETLSPALSPPVVVDVLKQMHGMMWKKVRGNCDQDKRLLVNQKDAANILAKVVPLALAPQGTEAEQRAVATWATYVILRVGETPKDPWAQPAVDSLAKLGREAPFPELRVLALKSATTLFGEVLSLATEKNIGQFQSLRAGDLTKSFGHAAPQAVAALDEMNAVCAASRKTVEQCVDAMNAVEAEAHRREAEEARRIAGEPADGAAKPAPFKPPFSVPEVWKRIVGLRAF